MLLLLWKVLLTSLVGREELQYYFCVQFPMKKVLLLLWKVLLTSLCGSEELQFYFCVQFPMKKVLLLLWKVLLTSWVVARSFTSISVFSFP